MGRTIIDGVQPYFIDCCYKNYDLQASLESKRGRVTKDEVRELTGGQTVKHLSETTKEGPVKFRGNLFKNGARRPEGGALTCYHSFSIADPKGKDILCLLAQHQAQPIRRHQISANDKLSLLKTFTFLQSFPPNFPLLSVK